MDPFSAAFEILPLASDGLKKFLAHNEVKRLYALIKADVRRSQLPPGTTDTVVRKIDELRVDPTVAGDVNGPSRTRGFPREGAVASASGRVV